MSTVTVEAIWDGFVAQHANTLPNWATRARERIEGERWLCLREDSSLYLSALNLCTAHGCEAFCAAVEQAFEQCDTPTAGARIEWARGLLDGRLARRQDREAAVARRKGTADADGWLGGVRRHESTPQATYAMLKRHLGEDAAKAAMVQAAATRNLAAGIDVERSLHYSRGWDVGQDEFDAEFKRMFPSLAEWRTTDEPARADNRDQPEPLGGGPRRSPR